MRSHELITRGLVAMLLLSLGAQAFAARTTTYLHNDGLGSVVAATNQAGAVLWRKDYAPFGEQIDSTPDSERTAYTGKQHDDAIGLTYFGGRHFDPELGRFTSVDPVAFTEQNAMSFNRYLYVNNNPYKYVDPDGEFLTYVAKFVIDVGINVALNYVTTGEANLKGALKESVIGLINPIPGKNAGKLLMALGKASKKAPDPRATMGIASKVDNAAPDFDTARRAAFDKAGMTDPSRVVFSKVDPKTGTVVEFKGSGGAKVGYDGPHKSPGPHHDTQHISWQTGGKRSQGGRERGNEPYSGPQHPSRPDRK